QASSRKPKIWNGGKLGRFYSEEPGRVVRWCRQVQSQITIAVHVIRVRRPRCCVQAPMHAVTYVGNGWPRQTHDAVGQPRSRQLEGKGRWIIRVRPRNE